MPPVRPDRAGPLATERDVGRPSQRPDARPRRRSPGRPRRRRPTSACRSAARSRAAATRPWTASSRPRRGQRGRQPARVARLDEDAGRADDLGQGPDGRGDTGTPTASASRAARPAAIRRRAAGPRRARRATSAASLDGELRCIDERIADAPWRAAIRASDGAVVGCRIDDAARGAATAPPRRGRPGRRGVRAERARQGAQQRRQVLAGVVAGRDRRGIDRRESEPRRRSPGRRRPAARARPVRRRTPAAAPAARPGCGRAQMQQAARRVRDGVAADDHRRGIAQEAAPATAARSAWPRCAGTPRAAPTGRGRGAWRRPAAPSRWADRRRPCGTPHRRRRRARPARPRPARRRAGGTDRWSAPPSAAAGSGAAAVGRSTSRCWKRRVGSSWSDWRAGTRTTRPASGSASKPPSRPSR